MSNLYFVEDEDDIPEELVYAVAKRIPIYVESDIGWIKLDDPDFRCNMVYRVGDE